jgi:transcriptional regulatory protein RtcR
VQLAQVLRICHESRMLSDAGRKLFAVSRLGRKQPNDADRPGKYLARFGVTWDSLRPG